MASRGNPRLEERLGHPVRRPGLLRPRLEHEPDLHRDNRQPERVHARRIRWQDETEDRTLGLETDRHAAFFAVARGEHVEREPARQRRQDAPHLGKHEAVLLHVRAAHSFGEARARRLRARELVRRLRPVAHRQRRVHVELAGRTDTSNEIVDWDLAQHFARPLRLPHVPADQPAVGAADFCNRLTSRKVDDIVHLHAGVRLTPTEDRKVNHQ